MKLIANSLIEHNGEIYYPGAVLPEADTATQESWLGKGIAVKSDYPADEAPADMTPENGETITGHLDPEQLSAMTIQHLKNLAEDIGADTKACKAKDDYVQAIVAVEVEAPADGALEDEPHV